MRPPRPFLTALAVLVACNGDDPEGGSAEDTVCPTPFLDEGEAGEPLPDPMTEGDEASDEDEGSPNLDVIGGDEGDTGVLPDFAIPVDPPTGGDVSLDVLRPPAVPIVGRGTYTLRRSSWTPVSGTSLYARRPTVREMRENDWGPQVTLFASPEIASKGHGGAPRLSVPLISPRATTSRSPASEELRAEIAEVMLERLKTRRGPLQVATHRGSTRATRPLVHVYGAEGLTEAATYYVRPSETLVHGIALDTGGIALAGVSRGGAYELLGPLAPTRLEHLPPPGMASFQLTSTPGSGAHFSVPGFYDPPAQCTDGLDNDADALQDECDVECLHHPDWGCGQYEHQHALENARSMTLFGDAVYCAENPSWAARLQYSGAYAASLLNQVDVDDIYRKEPYDPSYLDEPPRELTHRLVMIGCYTGFASRDAAKECADDSTGGATCDAYPLAGIGALAQDGLDPFPPKSTTLLGQSWKYAGRFFAAASTANAELLPAQVAGIVVGRGIFSKEVVGSDPVGGVAVPWPEASGFGGVANIWQHRGALVTTTMSLEGTGVLVAHETAHTIGVDHVADPTSFMYYDVEQGAASGLLPILGILDAANSSDQSEDPRSAWGAHAHLHNYPRYSGFEFSGCSQDAECTYIQGECLDNGCSP